MICSRKGNIVCRASYRQRSLLGPHTSTKGGSATRPLYACVKLGWILAGRTSESNEGTAESTIFILMHGKDRYNETTFLTGMDKSLPAKPNIEDFWKLESIGVSDSPIESDNDVALKRFKETLKYEEGRYTVKWPWKEESPDLTENRALALGRLKSQNEKRIMKILFI